MSRLSGMRAGLDRRGEQQAPAPAFREHERQYVRLTLDVTPEQHQALRRALLDRGERHASRLLRGALALVLRDAELWDRAIELGAEEQP